MDVKNTKLLVTVLILLFSKEAFSNTLKFPTDFTFGVGTSSYQIEGGWNANGKGVNIWDTLTHNHPDWIEDHSTGDIACDSYHLWENDIDLLKYLGVNFYRFSLSWTRLLPTGFSNVINPDGIRYYNGIINALLENNIQPMVTLYHWDLPQPFQDIGGWPNPVLAKYFEDYAQVVFRLFGDRVKYWITFNEPAEICVSGYGSEAGAPGLNFSGFADYLCGKTLLLAHAKAFHLYKRKHKALQKGLIGISINGMWGEPKTQAVSDVEAAERFMQMGHGWWMHPILSKTGDYPQVMKERIAKLSKAERFSESRLPEFSSDEVKYIQGTFDFLGLNHYTTRIISDTNVTTDANSYSYWNDVGVESIIDPQWKKSSAFWLCAVPWGFRKFLNKIKNDYENPMVYITENGWADGGELNDQGRINYYKDYLNSVLEAIHLDGCNVKGYAAWSLMNNMEWRGGYTAKFGLYYVNFTDPRRKRTPKASVNFYKEIIKNKVMPADNETFEVVST